MIWNAAPPGACGLGCLVGTNQLAGLRAANERLRKRQAEQLKKALPLAIADMATRAVNDNDE